VPLSSQTVSGPHRDGVVGKPDLRNWWVEDAGCPGADGDGTGGHDDEWHAALLASTAV
jgi:hypothetical protein